jgi:hypothetical protein
MPDGGKQPAEALTAYRDELVRRMRALPFTDRRRGQLADQIVQIERTIDRCLEEGARG